MTVRPGETIHYLPMDDLIDHEVVAEQCVCGPRLQPLKADDGSVSWQIVHFPLDGQARTGMPEPQPS